MAVALARLVSIFWNSLARFGVIAWNFVSSCLEELSLIDFRFSRAVPIKSKPDSGCESSPKLDFSVLFQLAHLIILLLSDKDH